MARYGGGRGRKREAEVYAGVPAWLWGATGCVFVLLVLVGVVWWWGPRISERAKSVLVEKPALPAIMQPVVPRVSASVPIEMPALPTEVPASPVSRTVVSPVTVVVPLPVQPLPTEPVWRRNAVPFEAAAVQDKPQLAIVLDDMGGLMELSTRAVRELPAAVTLSFFGWSEAGVALAQVARAEGHEIMVHVPMEPQPHGAEILAPGPDALLVGMSPTVIAELLRKNMAPLAAIAVGANNHMGSKFTEWAPGMRAVLTTLQADGFMFLDSKTAAPTATQAARKGLQLPVLTRDVFLDHELTPEAIRHELQRAATLAEKRSGKGVVIAIGHPLPETLEVLKAELPGLVSRGIVLVPVTAALR